MTYLLFTGSEYYPCGPSDYVGVYTQPEEAVKEGKRVIDLPHGDNWFAIFCSDGSVFMTEGNWYGRKTKGEEVGIQ